MQDYTHESCNSYKIILRGLIVHIILVLHNLPKCIKDAKIVYCLFASVCTPVHILGYMCTGEHKLLTLPYLCN